MMPSPGSEDVLALCETFFAKKGWRPFDFQVATWRAYLDEESGLVQVPTGSGKTLAATLAAICRVQLEKRKKKSLRIIYVTPLRALSRDIRIAMEDVIEQMNFSIGVESRTGDTTAAQRKKQLTEFSEILLTTPESLSVLISNENSKTIFSDVDLVILDEWHELVANKRGSLLELSLAFLRRQNVRIKVWALSATVGNLQELAQVAVGVNRTPVIISSTIQRTIQMDVVLPKDLRAIAWGGHLGRRLLPDLIAKLDRNESTLLFVSTRSQVELWYEGFAEAVPDFLDEIAVHHGSLDRDEREEVENRLKEGSVKWVIATSSLDLGVDFEPVERVVQIGSPKMVARLVQRAGRSGHSPSEKSKLLFLPTNFWELLELEACKRAIAANDYESRRPPVAPMDVLIQYMMTCACGEGLVIEKLKAELKSTVGFQSVADEQVEWCLQFLSQGGKSLVAYPQFHKIYFDDELKAYRPANSHIARLHRMSIGTIATQPSMSICYQSRKTIGNASENFLSRLKKGEVFQFGGKRLEFLMIKDMKAYVKPTTRKPNTIPVWAGTKLPLSETLSHELQREIAEPSGAFLKNVTHVFQSQEKISVMPRQSEILIEILDSREGRHFFCFPFEGGLVHEGIAHLWASLFAKKNSATFSFSVNDYGFEILGPKKYPFVELFDKDFFSTVELEQKLIQLISFDEVHSRQFREVAQISGMIFVGFPGVEKTAKQMQISSSLLFDVLKKYEGDSLLLKQAKDETMDRVYEITRLTHVLEKLQNKNVIWKLIQRPSPLSFPLLVNRFGLSVSSESLDEKLLNLQKEWQVSS